MKMLLMLGALLGSLAAAPVPDGGEAVPLSLYQGKQFTIGAMVAGKPRTFLFDTGEGLTMISPQLARALGCEPWGNITAFRMFGDRLDTKRCDGVSFGIGSGRYVAPSVIVYDLGEIAGKEVPPLDGAVGLDLFAGRTITIDLVRRCVILETPASVRRKLRDAVKVPLRLVRGDAGGLDFNLGVTTPRGLAWMELDTGNAGPTIFASQAIAPLLGLNAASREPQDVVIRLGTAELKTRARVFPGMIMDGNIGMQLVRDRAITLDLKNGRAWLGPEGSVR
jgi:hypothetical protein